MFDAPPEGKVYRGTPPGNQPGPGTIIVVEGGKERPLNPRYNIRNHSPDGFMWGYGGSGPAQTALAILVDATDEATALARETHYQDFKFAVIAKLPQDRPWQLSVEDVLGWVAARRSTVNA